MEWTTVKGDEWWFGDWNGEFSGTTCEIIAVPERVSKREIDIMMEATADQFKECRIQLHHNALPKEMRMLIKEDKIQYEWYDDPKIIVLIGM